MADDQPTQRNEHGGTAALLPQITIVAFLVVSLVILHRFVGEPDGRFDPRGLLAFGFVVLASYTIGALVDIIKLPHITGYLLAGVLFGPSVAEYLPAVPPFESGVLNEEVIGQLSLLDTLAIALIALSAGGELKIEALRSGLGAIAGVLGFQLIVLLLFVTAFIVSLTGYVPGMMLPGMGGMDLPTAIALGAVVAFVSFATSPAATLAVISESGATGVMARTVMSSVVLKDVIVVIGFTVAAVVASGYLGLASEQGNLFLSLAQHIGGSLLFGAAIGLLMAVYLRFVRQEVLLFLVGVVYAGSFAAQQLHLDPVLLFLAAGFTVSNFSRHGHDLIESVERLAMPVFVVFFTLAGAKLHLKEVFDLGAIALALVGVRVAAIFVGVSVGAAVGRADPGTRRYGWMGFVSQAGVAITLSAKVGEGLGEPGAALATLMIAAVGINEMIGPVLLKFGLSLAGETAAGSRKTIEPEAYPSELPPAKEPLVVWEPEVTELQPWGRPIDTRSFRLNERLEDLKGDLQRLLNDLDAGPIDRFRTDAELFLRNLRREFLRHHRRLSVFARSAENTDQLAARLRTEQAELADRWRGVVLGRAARLARSGWTPEQIVETIDGLVDALPDHIEAPYAEISFIDRPKQTTRQAIARIWLRQSRALRRTFHKKGPRRHFDLRNLGRYHLSSEVPLRLEGLAALLVQAERHLASRVRVILDEIVAGYDALAHELEASEEPDTKELLLAQRARVEDEFRLGLSEVEQMATDAVTRTTSALGRSYAAFCTDALIAGTFDLPDRSRRTTRVFRRRLRGLELLSSDIRAHRDVDAAGYALLAMELELVALEARVKVVVEEHAAAIESDVRGRTLVQAQRVEEALGDTLATIDECLEAELQGDTLASALKESCEKAERVAAAASRSAIELIESLHDERRVTQLLEAVGRASASLTTAYDVVAGRVERGEWSLPPISERVEVPFRETVRTYIDAEIAPELVVRTRSLADSLRPYLAVMQELERTIAFNIELALSELELVAEETTSRDTAALLKEMLVGQLERGAAQLSEQRLKSEKWPEQFGDALRDAVLGSLDRLRDALVDGEISNARLAAMRRAEARRRFFRDAWRLPEIAGQVRLQLRRALTAVAGADRLERWRHALGLPGRVRGDAFENRAFLRSAEREDLPLVYRRLFAAETLEAGDVLTGREEEIRLAESVLKAPAGRLRTVALVGVDGVGKAAISQAIVRTRGWRKVERVNFNEPTSVAQVEAMFRARGSGNLIVLEGLHWLMAMRPGGFEPLRAFVEGIVADAGKNAWLLHADLLVWRYASTVAAMSHAFPDALIIEPLNAEQLEAAVMARHRLSGYGHAFERLEGDSPIAGLVERGANRFRRPYERYFQDLHRATGGLVRDALRMWIASVRRVGADEIVYMGPLPSSPFTAMTRLPEDVLLNLYQVARQGWIDVDVQSHLYRIDESTARAQLARLANYGLLAPEGGEGCYRVSVHLRGFVVRALQRRGWVA